jgi:hypothetical protein
MEQRAIITFLKKTATDTFEMMKSAYGEECLFITSVFELQKRFRGQKFL